MYVVFDCKNNKNLFLSIKNRLIELGYRYLAGEYYDNICFQMGEEDTLSCSDLRWAKNHPKEFTMGSLDTLFNTEEYKLKQDLFVDGYKVMIDNPNKAVQISNVYLSNENIREIAELFFTVTDK